MYKKIWCRQEYPPDIIEFKGDCWSVAKKNRKTYRVFWYVKKQKEVRKHVEKNKSMA